MNKVKKRKGKQQKTKPLKRKKKHTQEKRKYEVKGMKKKRGEKSFVFFYSFKGGGAGNETFRV